MPKKINLRAYNITENQDDNSAEINMYGEVVQSVPTDFWTGEKVDGLYIALDEFLEDLDRLRTKDHLTVHINSVGGDTDAGIAIYNRLKEMKDVVTVTDSLAASAASVIFQSGNIRKMNVGAKVMIHGNSTLLFGYYNANDLKEVNKMISAYDNSIAQIYSERTGIEIDKIKTMMSGTSWMAGEEAIEKGFADEMVGEPLDMTMTADRKSVICNGIKIELHGIPVPEGLKIMKQSAKAVVNRTEGGHENMTVEELRREHPELVKEIENSERKKATEEAVEAERQRIRDIEEIEAAVADKELIKEAKYGDKSVTASELALKAMKKQAELGNLFLQKNKEDVQTSGTEDINGVPPKDEQNKDEQDMNAAVNAFKAMKGVK